MIALVALKKYQVPLAKLKYCFAFIKKSPEYNCVGVFNVTAHVTKTKIPNKGLVTTNNALNTQCPIIYLAL